MKLSESERETLIGPAMTGVVVGIFFAVCAVAFNSEYKAAALSDWSAISDTMLSFLAGLLVAFVPFGLAPVLIGRVRPAPRRPPKGRRTGIHDRAALTSILFAPRDRTRWNYLPRSFGAAQHSRWLRELHAGITLNRAVAVQEPITVTHPERSAS